MLPHSSVREARERVRSAIQSSDLPFPRRRITVNLAPADLPKHGSGLALPIALAVIGAEWAEKSKKAPWSAAPLALGELGLDGRVRPVRGVLSVVEAAAREGARQAIVPRENAAEAALVPGLEVFAVGTLREAWGAARGLEVQPWSAAAPSEASSSPGPDLAEVRGLAGGRRVLEVAAAGGHDLLLEGPPGSGKSMLAKRLGSLLPFLPVEQALEVTRIRSAAGLLGERAGLLERPPVRAPHHSASVPSMVGGGSPLRPGEVTLAHRGVLFLDEMPEFSRSVLEALRQPLQDGEVTIVRARQAARFPASFQLVATCNPCPCGKWASPAETCTCLPGQRERYRQRVSGPLTDRIDRVAWVEPVPVRDLLASPRGESSAEVRERVTRARSKQAERWKCTPGLLRNAKAPLPACLPLFDRRGRRELEAAVRATRGSGRAVQQLVRVAVTLGDLAGESVVQAERVQEALLLCRQGPEESSTRRPQALHTERNEECRPSH